MWWTGTDYAVGMLKAKNHAIKSQVLPCKLLLPFLRLAHLVPRAVFAFQKPLQVPMAMACMRVNQLQI
eukprot:SAG11_NODE_124_length_15798_cov_14.675776_6_plen_68_part_00